MLKNKDSLGMNPAILSENTAFEAREAYKAVRTNILHFLSGDKKKQILITSPYAGAGKTTNAINLAITFSQVGKKILLIDADMRKPMVNQTFSFPLAPGLSEILSDGVPEKLPVHESGHENFHIITAGSIPENPAELLYSANFTELLKKAGEVYDYIFIDAPPINIVTDAVIIASRVDATVLIIRQNVTARDSLEYAVEALRKVGANLIGYVLNAVDMKKFSYRYGHYYGKYGQNEGYYKYEK